MKRLILLGLVLALALPAQAAKLEKVTYVGPPNVALTAFVAAEKGMFLEEGLDVDCQSIQTGKLAMEAIVAERADFGAIVSTNLTYAGFQSDALRVIASHGITLDDVVVFPASSPIQKPADLKGKKIGLALSTSSQDFLIHLLAKNGLSWTDITPVSLQPPTMLAALKGGAVDAVVTWQPWRTSLKSLDGGTREITNAANIYPRQSFTATTAAYLAKHPDVPAKLLRALIKAEAFINKNPEETAAIITKRTGQNIESVRTYIVPQNINMNHGILKLITDYALWVTRNQGDFLGKPMPDYRKNIAPEFLKQVAPERVEKGL